MTPVAQNLFLSKLESALSDVPAKLRKTAASSSALKAEGDPGRLDPIRQRTQKERLALLDQMMMEGRTLNLNILPVKDLDAAGRNIQQLAQAKASQLAPPPHAVAWCHPLVAGLQLEERFREISVPVFFTDFSNPQEKASLREKIAAAFMGITSAEFCLADSATLVLKTRAGQARSVSLAPAVHVAVVLLEQVLADLNELYAMLKSDPAQQKEGLTRCLTLITGPSKTADIEAVMVHGVHGPREVYLYVVTG